MKELSIEQKAKAYDEALEKARCYYTGANGNEDMITITTTIFPELKESEDERIRKIIKQSLKSFFEGKLSSGTNDVDYAMCLTWLKKQGEHANFRDKIQVGDKVTRNEDGVLVNLSQLNRVAKKDEKQGEQESVDKVEPKFHKGEWIANGDYTWQIVSVTDLDYILQSQDGNVVDDTISHVDEQFHSFTIKDAKDGDVLVAHECLVLFKDIYGLNIRCYCTYYFMNNESFFVDTLQNKTAFTPATKKQRDTLMKAMANAGYTFDFEKKELKKIEQIQAIDYSDSHPKDNWELIHEFVNKFGRIPKDEDELNVLIEYVFWRQKPTWSEEDEEIHRKCICAMRASACGFPEEEKFVEQVDNWLESLKGRVQLQPKQEWSGEDKGNLLDVKCIIDEVWHNQYVREEIDHSGEELESLWHWLDNIWQRVEYPQKQWTPSEEQMDALHYVTNFDYGGHKATLVSLYEQLKKLKG